MGISVDIDLMEYIYLSEGDGRIMAKKAPVKKSKRRLKRSIRRSLAAVLMVTAIGVAAIPVPENVAAPTDGSREEVKDPHAEALEKFKYQASSGPSQSIPSTSSFKLDKYKDAELNELFEAMDAGSVYPSMTVSDLSDGTYTLGWQFMYYPGKDPSDGATKGIVCKYNDAYSKGDVKLDLAPITEYYTVTEATFDKYFDHNHTDGGCTELNGMRMSSDPMEKIEAYSYESRDSLTDEEKEFYNTYFKAAYEAKTKEFTDYKTAYDRWVAAGRDPGTEPSKPAPFEPKNADGTPATWASQLATLDEKTKYYCDHDTVLQTYGTGYTLLRVNNQSPNQMGYIYVARGGTPASGQSNDENGFLVKRREDYLMCAIGDGAFKGVSNIVNLSIPDMIGYIGNDAFADATLMESVQLHNVKNIGNRAFSGCTKLATVELAQGTKTIGEECFKNTAITTIALPSTVTDIEYGAFADCSKLATVNLNALNSGGAGTVIDDFAFYNCKALTDIQMDTAVIASIGEGAFAVDSGAVPLSVKFPKSSMTNKDSIGDFMFAGRASLQSVVFPEEYGGESNPATLPDNMFHGCYNLQFVEFPVDFAKNPHGCGSVSYNPAKLFADVVNKDFYVQGPEMKSMAPNDYAEPRMATWEAVIALTGVRVPYLYIRDGKKFYEVSDGNYLMCVDENGILISCTFAPNPDQTQNIKLDIPDQVGNTKVVGIASGCFSDEELNQEVISLYIPDDSISTIDDGVFKGWKKLRTVTIGNSVTSIGREAFKDCESLEDVTFHTPTSGYEAFQVGEDAFVTGSNRLMFHGDIDQNYQPFTWAMNKDNVIKKDDNIRVCYQSLSPTYMTVMYNPNTDMVTLLDYPKHSQVSAVLNQTHEYEINQGNYGSYERMMVARRYEVYDGKATADSGVDHTNDYEGRREAFRRLWIDASKIVDSDEQREAKENAYASEYYGPWISDHYVRDVDWENESYDCGCGGVVDGEVVTADNSILEQLEDIFFEPIVAYAADTPQAYYTRYPYVVVDNAETNDPYRMLTEEERLLVEATKNVVVPEGVDSIDVYGFYNNLTADGEKGSYDNRQNVIAYLQDGIWDSDTKKMYIGPASATGSDPTAPVNGLFSGYYVDYAAGDYPNAAELEKYSRGNDRIESITLKSVKYLPDYAFDSCERLVLVDIGPDCRDIGKAPFRGCYSMQNMVGNDTYSAENGIIYSKNEDGSYTIEECMSARGRLVGQGYVTRDTDALLSSVSSIKPGAFEDCDDITRVDFGQKQTDTAGLMVIPEDCFRNCDQLNTVILPMSVNDIGRNAFSGANELNGLTIYGKEVKISGHAFDGEKTKPTLVRAYPDSAVVRYVDEYGEEYRLQLDPNALGELWMVTFLNPDGTLLENAVKDEQPVENPQYVENDTYAIVPDAPKIDQWTFDHWLGTNGITPTDKIQADTVFIAQGYSNDGMIGGKYMVDFYDQVDGSKIGETQYVAPGSSAIAPQAPTHTGYTFQKWSSEEWKNVQKNLTIMAMYSGSGTSGGNTSGGSTNTPNSSNNTTNTPNTSSNNTSNTSSSKSTSTTSTSNTSSSTSSSSTSTSSTTSDGRSVTMYTLLVQNGSGSGSYAQGATVVISAYPPAEGMVFSNWTSDSNGVTLMPGNTSPVATFVMPGNNATITANYVPGTAGATTTPVSTGGGTTTTTPEGNTTVDITKPGISNKDLATANVNGSTDNFIVKISETDAATQAVAAALTNKYGSLENLLYYAMDITLWDATGTYQLTGDQVAGLSVDITIPIPDALVAYGGNNMAGAVINGDQLENLNESFTTINGVPCIRFAATHFSPYTIYVDTGNLTEGMLDVTPKTGDPIHPKWFLSIGLACLSVILFMKKDKKVKAKTA